MGEYGGSTRPRLIYINGRVLRKWNPRQSWGPNRCGSPDKAWGTGWRGGAGKCARPGRR